MTDSVPGPVSNEGPSNQGPKEKRGLPSWAKLAIPFVLLVGGVVYLLAGSGASEAFVYSKTIDEVLDNPGSFNDRELRVEGELKNGSIRFREDPCEWRFVLTKGDREMPVEFPQCVVPDTFRDGMGISVTVQGAFRNDGTFLANTVVPRCPSKYEMKEKMEAGEAMPHAMPES